MVRTHRSRRSRSLALGLALALVAAGVGACSASSDEPATDAAATPAAGEPPVVPGFDGITIHLGELTAASGPNALVGLPYTAGSKAYFDYVNTELGGIGKKYKVVLDIQDTGGDPAKAAQAYAEVQGDTVLLAQVLGAPVLDALLPQLRTDGALAASVLAADDLHDANLFPSGVPVAAQAANALSWYLDHHPNPGPICSLVQDDAYGAAGQAGLVAAAKRLHVDLAVEATVPAPPHGPGKLDAVLAQLTDAGCDAVILATTPNASTSILTQAGAAQLDTQWIGLSASWTSTLSASVVLPYLEDHLAVVTEGPSWNEGGSDGMVELVRIHAAYAPVTPPDPWFTAGFLQAAAVTRLLDKAVALGDLSREGILAASAKLGKIGSKGVAGAFTYGPPADRVPPTVSSISKVDPKNGAGLTVTEARVQVPFAAALLTSGT